MIQPVGSAPSCQGLKGYMPMLGFLFEAGVCVYDEFREGNVPPQASQLAFYRACQERIPMGKKIGRYRADSASYQADLINALETDDVLWAITADKDKAVKAAIAIVSDHEWKEPVVGCGYQVTKTVHTMNRTNKAFRLIIKRWVLPRLDLF